MTECIGATRHVNVPFHAPVFSLIVAFVVVFLNGAIFEILPLWARVYKQ